MKEKIQINTVEMVRRIRDEQAQILAGKSKSEIMAFFKSEGEAVRQEAKSERATQQQSQQKG